MFVYGFSFDSSNNKFDIDEGAGQIAVTIPVGAYTATKFCQQLQKALNTVGTLGYTVSLDRSDFSITITCQTGTFRILGGTGASITTSCLSIMGFDMVDTAIAAEHVSGQIGKIYRVQFPVQSYVPPGKNKSLTNATVLKSASGNNVSIQYFGEERFTEMDIRLINSISQPPGSPLRSNSEGVEQATDFMDFCIELNPVEFIPDETAPEVFHRVRLDQTPESQSGTGYKLKEHWDMNLPNYFYTGVLKFRIIEETY